MKKIDKLILSSFLGPFVLTFVVVVFILLTQHMLKYFDDIVGKDLGFDVLAQLLFYFAVFMTPIAIPLAVLLSSLMTFGNLGEHFELTAIKSAGISLLRAMFPIFIFVLGLTVLAFYSNNYFVPKAALEAYSLLYDIKQKKPALDLKEGAFYNGIPDFSIKVNKKGKDGKSIEDIIIYDHRGSSGNKKITMADSGAMYTINNDRYLKLELYDGNFYFEDYAESGKNRRANETMARSSFSRSEYILDLSSFGLGRTDKSLFQGNRIMRNLGQLTKDVDSVNSDILDAKVKIFNEPYNAFYYHLKNDSLTVPDYLIAHKILEDSLDRIKQEKKRRLAEEEMEKKKALNAEPDSIKPVEIVEKPVQNKKEPFKVNDKKKPNNKKPNNKKPSNKKILKSDKLLVKADGKNTLKNRPKPVNRPKVVKPKKPDQIYDTLNHFEIIAYLQNDSSRVERAIESSLNNVRQVKSKIQAHNTSVERMRYERAIFDIQYHKILANSLACIIMFLIGAPLGAIIKKGGLGIPVLLSITFFIIFYVITMTGEKWSKQEFITPLWGIWSANLILFPIGLFFLRQARNDVRLFEADFYNVMIDKIKIWFKKFRKGKKENQQQ
ncbi:MAG TPA: LptF/LptG family permease [Fulvivirga sp.]|nr:LptF/LptG family permease [Fulvivirga sp.]